MKRKQTLIIASILIILLLFGSLFIVLYFNRPTDGKKFKEEYNYINIDKKNPFIYKTANDIIDLINKKETFLVYFGYPDENKKEILESLIKVLKDEDVESIYYVNIENIRNRMLINKGVPETYKMGTMGYYKLLEVLNDLLDDYIIKDIDGKEYKAGKIIKNPTLLAVYNGNPVKLSNGFDDAYNDFKEVLDFIKPSNSCNEDIGC